MTNIIEVNSNNYAAFNIVTDMKKGDESAIPLGTEKGFKVSLYKCPGGRPKSDDSYIPERTAMRETFDEFNIIVIEPERKDIFLKISRPKYDVLFIESKYHSGILKKKAEMDKAELFTHCEIKQMIREGKIVSDHSFALNEFFKLVNKRNR